MSKRGDLLTVAAHRDALYWLGCYYYSGMHSKEQVDPEFAQLSPATHLQLTCNSPTSMDQVDPEFAQAYKLWAKAAEMGCRESRHNQACMLLTGQVNPKP